MKWWFAGGCLLIPCLAFAELTYRVEGCQGFVPRYPGQTCSNYWPQIPIPGGWHQDLSGLSEGTNYLLRNGQSYGMAASYIYGNYFPNHDKKYKDLKDFIGFDSSRMKLRLSGFHFKPHKILKTFNQKTFWVYRAYSEQERFDSLIAYAPEAKGFIKIGVYSHTKDAFPPASQAFMDSLVRYNITPLVKD